MDRIVQGAKCETVAKYFLSCYFAIALKASVFSGNFTNTSPLYINKHFKLSAWIEKWIELYKAPNVKPSTLQNIRDVIKPAAAVLGEKDLTAITTEDLQKLFVSFSSERTRDLCRTYLDQLFKKAELLGIDQKKSLPCSRGQKA